MGVQSVVKVNKQEIDVVEFCIIKPCCLLILDSRFVGKYSLHLRDRKKKAKQEFSMKEIAS
jgi:hypothetical protein